MSKKRNLKKLLALTLSLSLLLPIAKNKIISNEVNKDRSYVKDYSRVEAVLKKKRKWPNRHFFKIILYYLI